MALRVLLADESSTIKKVMQLALQDFGVEVKSVPIGLDVLQVTRSFQPDIIFADVLLSKKSGYEVAAELKTDPALKSIPVVLMWSGFMEIDEARAKASGADRRLEKPFDADHLRSLVKEMVQKVKENQIVDYLTFPELPEIVETPGEDHPIHSSYASFTPLPENEPPPPDTSLPLAAPVRSAPQSQHQKSAPPEIEPLMSPDLEDPDDFQQVPLPGSKTVNIFEKSREEEDWRQGGLEQFRVTPKEQSPVFKSTEPTDDLLDLTDASVATTDGIEYASLDELEDLTVARPAQPVPQPPSMPPKAPPPRAEMPRKPAPPAPQAPPPRAAGPAPRTVAATAPSPGVGPLDPLRAEEVLREQVREVLENIAWKIIPDIAERIVREEIQKLLKEAERLS